MDFQSAFVFLALAVIVNCERGSEASNKFKNLVLEIDDELCKSHFEFFLKSFAEREAWAVDSKRNEIFAKVFNFQLIFFQQSVFLIVEL